MIYKYLSPTTAITHAVIPNNQIPAVNMVLMKKRQLRPYEYRNAVFIWSSPLQSLPEIICIEVSRKFWIHVDDVNVPFLVVPDHCSRVCPRIVRFEINA